MNSTHEIEKNHYRIMLRGHLDQKWSGWFTGFDLSYGNDVTVLTGTVPDQSSLHGLLNRIRDLNIPLLSVERIKRNE